MCVKSVDMCECGYRCRCVDAGVDAGMYADVATDVYFIAMYQWRTPENEITLSTHKET